MDSAHQRALRLVDAGLLSDPANFDMYFYTRTVNGCPEYITCRGTSQLENYWRIQERQATCKPSLGNIKLSNNRSGRIFTSANCSSETIQFALMDLNVLWNVTKARVCLSSPRHGSRSYRNEDIMSLDMGLLSDLQILEERLFNEKSAASPVQLKRKVVEVGDPAHEVGTWLKIPDIEYGNLVALGTDGVEIASIASRVFAQETDTEQAKTLALKMAAVHTGTKQSWLAEVLGLPHCPRPVRGNDERVLCKVLERKHCRGDLPAAETKQVRARACDAHTPHSRC